MKQPCDSQHKRKIKIGVLGPNQCSQEDARLGFEVGSGVARRNGILLCGGLGGMMEAAAQGAHARDGLTIGLLPSDRASDANPHIDIALPTGLGPFRNMLLVQACDAVIAIQGGYGTLSEISFALRLKTPIVGLETWSVHQNDMEDQGIIKVTDPSEAVEQAFRLACTRWQNLSV